ncbi:hypothetical protein CVIRNUC_003996 [Coccomyxa viridis]|uniref:Uncharacterized protein n=1 Tax=Coccomyxa viridis TaxID=1274662 RepID=A0AAV1I1T8_9CHLO|nr:hypothetical protein CVIRNUC_003996 [Coccomyxa viridis]
MAGRSHATLRLDGREVFAIKLDQPGKVSERISELRAEIMKRLNAHMGATAPATDEVDMLEEPVSEDEEADAAPKAGKGKKKRRRSQ